MAKKQANSKKVTVSELFDLISNTLLEKVADDLQVDKHVKKFKATHLFHLVLFSILNTERLSLRIMEDNFKDPAFEALAPTITFDSLGYTGIRKRLITINSDYFHQIYEELYEQLEKLYPAESLEKLHIKRYDSTMIASFTHLLEGMKVGNTSKGKTQVKFTAELTNAFLLRFEYHQDQSMLSEEKALKQVIENATPDEKAIHLFDNGLKKRETLINFDDKENKILFVTRFQSNTRYEMVRPFSLDDGFKDTEDLSFVQDSIVQLYSSGHKLEDKEFRLVEYRVKEDNSVLYFVTNVMDLPAERIAQLYQKRWDIEVLFRFMKQEMNLTHFVCNDLNAIKVMLYMTLIASMLVLIYKHKNNIKSYKRAKTRFFKELLYTILLDIFEHPDERKQMVSTMRKFIQRE